MQINVSVFILFYLHYLVFSDNWGKNFTRITEKIGDAYIKKINGLQKHTHEAKTVSRQLFHDLQGVSGKKIQRSQLSLGLFHPSFYVGFSAVLIMLLGPYHSFIFIFIAAGFHHMSLTRQQWVNVQEWRWWTVFWWD